MKDEYTHSDDFTVKEPIRFILLM